MKLKKSVLVFLIAGVSAALFFMGCVTGLDLTRPSTPRTEKQYVRFIQKNAPSEDAFVAVHRIAENYIEKKMWPEAAGVFEKYHPLFKFMDTRFEKIIGLLNAEEEEEIKIANLGPNINSASSEYKPTPAADGTSLYFTGGWREDGFGGEDIFVSKFENGSWQAAENLGFSINSFGNESINSISADGNKILLFGNYDASLGNGDIFYTDKTFSGWGEVQHFPEPLNSQYFDADSYITSDGKAIFFTSDRPGGVGEYHEKDRLFHGSYWGNTDIYVCLLTDAGWSKLINLGSVVNTPYCERSPFLHPDGKTLYFSSDGHYGLGGLDVFKTTRLSEDSWTEWSEPENLGKSINTANDDWGYKISTAGDVAYFAAYDRGDGLGKSDIYSKTLPKEWRPNLVATITGKVTDTEGNPLAVDIKWENLTTGENVGQLKSDPQDGSFFIALPLGKKYGYYAELPGYYPVSDNVDLSSEVQAVNIAKDIVLMSVEELKKQDISVRMENLFFEFDSFSLLPESYPELKRLANFMQQNPFIQVEIAGHTDDRGSKEYNHVLSKKRAQAVVDYLTKLGVHKDKLFAIGYGEEKPIASNETEEGQQLNRRVEFRIVQTTAKK
ncbi:MAG: OmpA family protein [bacterium]